MQTTMTQAPALGLGTFATPEGGSFPGLVLGDRVLDLRKHLPDAASLTALLGDWETQLPRILELAEGDSSGEGHSEARSVSDLHPCVPFEPRQVFCAGANYYRHIVEMASAAIGRARPELSAEAVHELAIGEADARAADDPFIFIGLPSALCGAQDDVVLWGGARNHDWELELGVVIGKGGTDIPLDQAMEHVAGYTIVNDITTRDVIVRGTMPYSDLLSGKSRRTFFPVGPYIVPRSLVRDPRDLQITLTVNGEVMQNDSTSDLIHGVDRLVSYASHVAGLYPGDLLLTGSPSGNAAHHGNRWLTPGDVIESEIAGLGRQRNLCVADPTLG
jgi:2,4-diketo-3-deoxy-L-fuconate hydrolase